VATRKPFFASTAPAVAVAAATGGAAASSRALLVLAAAALISRLTVADPRECVAAALSTTVAGAALQFAFAAARAVEALAKPSLGVADAVAAADLLLVLGVLAWAGARTLLQRTATPVPVSKAIAMARPAVAAPVAVAVAFFALRDTLASLPSKASLAFASTLLWVAATTLGASAGIS